MKKLDLSGMPIIDKIIFNESGIYITQYNDGQIDRLSIDISGQYDKQALRELKQKVNSLRITKVKDRSSNG